MYLNGTKTFIKLNIIYIIVNIIKLHLTTAMILGISSKNF